MIAILVPVLGRPQSVEPFMESVAVTKEPHTVYFICSPNDKRQIRECEKSGAEVIIASFNPRGGDFARKINLAYEMTEEEWLFQAADDIRFSSGWDHEALKVAMRFRAGVVGTNDLGNPSVRKGSHSTHTLFSRKYITMFGSGTVDNSGKVFSELYDHQYCDTDFVQTAKHRKQWAFSKNSIVEHLHPHWGKAEMDTTYAKATRKTQEDMKLFLSRLVLIKDATRRVRREQQGVV